MLPFPRITFHSWLSFLVSFFLVLNIHSQCFLSNDLYGFLLSFHVQPAAAKWATLEIMRNVVDVYISARETSLCWRMSGIPFIHNLCVFEAISYLAPKPTRVKLVSHSESLPLHFEAANRLFILSWSLTLTGVIPLSITESITYYLGVVDANFNADRPRPGEVRERRYTLRIWKGECVFWDEQNDAWSSKGCRTSLTSTYTTTNCK